MSAQEQLAANVNKLSDISCTFTCNNPVLEHDRIAAINLYRIRQLPRQTRQGGPHPDRVCRCGKIHLSVTGDGIGFDPTLRANHEDMGCQPRRHA